MAKCAGFGVVLHDWLPKADGAPVLQLPVQVVHVVVPPAVDLVLVLTESSAMSCRQEDPLVQEEQKAAAEESNLQEAGRAEPLQAADTAPPCYYT